MGDEDVPAKLENALTPVVQAVLAKGEPPEQAAREVVRAVMRRQVRQHRGPLPDPETLSAYNQLIPNGAERCMALVEREAAHRHTQEDRLVSTHLSLSRDGQRIAAGLVLVLIAASVFLGYTGHDWLAGALGTTTIAGVAVVFVLRQKPGGSEEVSDDDSGEEVDDPSATSTTAEDEERRIEQAPVSKP